MIIKKELLERIQEHLITYGGLHVQIPINYRPFTDDAPYICACMKELDNIKYPDSLSQTTLAAARLTIYLVEMDLVNSFVNSSTPFVYGGVSGALVAGSLDSLENSIKDTFYSSRLPDDSVGNTVFRAVRFMSKLSTFAEVSLSNRHQFINSVLGLVMEQRESMFFTSFDSAQWKMAQHYLSSMGVEPSTGNAESYLEFKDVTKEDEPMIRYYGSVTKEEGRRPIIHMLPKTGAIVAQPKEYQIRKETKGERELYTLVEVIGNRVEVIPSELMKPIILNV